MPLRPALSEITQDLDVASHPARIAQLARAHRHSIVVVETDEDLNDFNCVMFALDLIGAIDPPMSFLGRYHMNLRFLGHLIERGELLELPEPADGALALYYNAGELIHVGIVAGNLRIRSKWGAGHVYEHTIWEVPESYGEQVRFFRAIDPEIALEVFLAFAGWRVER